MKLLSHFPLFLIFYDFFLIFYDYTVLRYFNQGFYKKKFLLFKSIFYIFNWIRKNPMIFRQILPRILKVQRSCLEDQIQKSEQPILWRMF